MAFVSDTRRVANCWRQPGNSHTANHVQAFLANTLDKLGGNRVVLLRADGGFCNHAILDEVRANTAAPRIGIRQHIKRRAAAKGKTLSLFANDPQLGHYRFAALVTDLALPAQEIWRSDRGHADCANRIKELKHDFAADSFPPPRAKPARWESCLMDFLATEACLNIAMLAYNLMSLFRQVVLKTAVLQSGSNDVQHTLKTLRYNVVAKAGYIVTQGRKDILKPVA